MRRSAAASRRHSSRFASRAPTSSCAAFHLTQCDRDSPVHVGQQFNNGTLMVIADRHKLITASLAAPPWRIYIEAFRRSDEYAYYYLFDPLLLIILKRRGLVHWHGAAVHHAARDVLIVGEGGAGKSTTTLCLLMHGAGFIADDEASCNSPPTACGRAAPSASCTVPTRRPRCSVIRRRLPGAPRLA